MATVDKPFSAERFVFADSQSLGPAPWDTRSLNRGRPGSSRQVKTRSKCLNASVKLGLQLVFLSLGFVLLAWKAMLPCYVTIAVCYASQVICEIDRSIFSASMNPLCKLALLSHSPNHLDMRRTLSTCPTTTLWTVRPYISHILMILWRQAPVSSNRNYASYGGGASVLRGYTSKTHDLPPPSIFGSLVESIFGYNPQYANVNGAGIVLEESMSVGEGECWRISGGTGHVAINLTEVVFVSHIVIDHASPTLLSEGDIASAPKDMVLWALLPPTANDAERTRSLNDFKLKKYGKGDLPESSRLLPIINFQYDVLKQPTRQIFRIPVRMPFATQVVVLEITTNGGSGTTCIYWLGIYGSRSIS